MTILNLTSFAQIRGVLTVSEADLPDETLASYGLDDDLAADLDSWAQGWAAIAVPEQARSLRLFSKYFCAAAVASSAPVFVLTKMSDGSNEGQRNGTEGFLWLSEAMRSKAQAHKSALLLALGTEPAPVGYTLVSAVRPTRDPIVEPRSAS